MEEKLEIILVTYNRKDHLQNTFHQIFDANSPIKHIPITILNNKSTDGTSELIEKYKTQFPNITHVINNYNIGGDANIAKAFEIATREYFWILCDDDEFDFSHWSEVEQAITDNYDAIVVANYINPKQDIAQLVKQMTFVPSTIYKRENITDTVMANIKYLLSTKFSQLAPALHLINENKNIKILDNWIVKMIPNAGYESYTRGMDNNVHPYLANNFWEVGFVNAIQLIKNKKTRSFILENMGLETSDQFETLRGAIMTNKKIFNFSKKNLSDMFIGLTPKLRIIFLMALLSLYCPFWISYNKKEKFIFVRLLKFKYYLRLKKAEN